LNRPRGAPAQRLTETELDRIKKTAIVAMFSDDELLDLLVLKGGNAMDLIHGVSSRASVDLDFSMADDFDQKAIQDKVQRVISGTFKDTGYHAFDIRLTQRPKEQMPDDLVEFWGGYLVEFKLIGQTRADEVGYAIDTMRREAINLGEGPKFTIDISRHEYVADKQAVALNGYQIYVYSPEMIVCEKLRAICQQLPEYGPIIQRGVGKQRARDFVDIEALVQKFGINVGSAGTQHIVSEMFRLKKVPLDFLGKVQTAKDFHALGFEQVKATMRPGVTLQTFNYYFDFVIRQCRKLEPLWNV
jgi:hypothetical protein